MITYVVRSAPPPTPSSFTSSLGVTSGLSAPGTTQPSCPHSKESWKHDYARHHSTLRGDRPNPYQRTRQEGRGQLASAPERATGLQRLLPDRGRQRGRQLGRLL